MDEETTTKKSRHLRKVIMYKTILHWIEYTSKCLPAYWLRDERV